MARDPLTAPDQTSPAPPGPATYERGPIVGTVSRILDPVDVAGRTVTVHLEVTEPDPVPLEPGWPSMVIGADVTAADFGTLAAGGRNAGARVVRTFCPPGAGIYAWGTPQRAVPAGVCEHISFKDWGSDTQAVSRVIALLDGIPAGLLAGPALLPEIDVYDPDGYSEGMPQSDGFSLLVTYFHEGEKDFLEQGLTALEWRRRHRLVYKTIRAHRNGHRVGYMPIQTGTWTDAYSVPGNPKGDRDPITWWAGVGDLVGYDAYVPSVTNKPPAPGLYPAPAAFFALPLQLAAATGRRLWLPELGVIRQGAPADSGAFRGQWIKQAIGYLREQGCAGVAWWDALGANSRDFRLTDPASAAAWADVLAGRA